jgi:hypothetical protein
MVTKIHGPLKVIAFNANGIARQRYELSKQLQDVHIDVALFSGTHNETSQEVLYSKLPLLSNQSLPGQERRNCHCC